MFFSVDLRLQLLMERSLLAIVSLLMVFQIMTARPSTIRVGLNIGKLAL